MTIKQLDAWNRLREDLERERDEARAALRTIVENVDTWSIAQLRAYIRALPWAKE
jgi:hypothetical protein